MSQKSQRKYNYRVIKIVDYLWCKHPEYRETWSAKSITSSFDTEVAISLSRRDFSDKPARQYLKMLTSEIGFPLVVVLFRAECLASVLPESDGEAPIDPLFLGLSVKLVRNPFSA